MPIPILVTALCMTALLIGCVEEKRMSQSERRAGATFYVATDGNDSWSGKTASPNPEQTDGPFATIERARDEIRRLKKADQLPAGGVRIEMRDGAYEIGKPLELTAEDSGSEAAPIEYRACPGEEVRLTGGRMISNFEPVKDPSVLSRLDESARSRVLQADLRELGITDFGDAKEGLLELFYRDKAMTVARWPNEGFVKITEVLGKTERDVRGTKGRAEGVFQFEGDRAKRWVGEKDLWVHGYWFWDWADQRQKVESLDAEKGTITTVPPHHGYGYRKGQWFYAYNILAELDTPGEWFLDREKGILYFWPPGPIEAGRPMVSVAKNLITMKDVSYTTLRGFIVEGFRATPISISGGSRNRVAGCIIKNSAKNAVSINGGTHNGVAGCNVYNMGEGGISVAGGDRKTLTPCANYVENNHIHHYGRWKPMYSAGVSFQGVGIRVAHNLIDNAPHCAILFGGNENLIEFNEIHSVCYESNDAGAIYAGRDWTQRGNIVRHNFLHHICGFEGRGCVGIYNDDMYCGTIMYGNLFYRVPMAAFVGGGRDCIIENNIFLDCMPAIHVDARAMGWAHACSDRWIEEGREKGTLSGIKYKEPPYSVKYPELVNILDDEPAAPKGNKIIRNIWRGGKWESVQGQAKPYIAYQDNLMDEDPKFVQGAAILERPGGFKEFQLRDDSPAYKLGFKKIPIAAIGLYKDPDRASWPPRHTIRPMVVRAAKGAPPKKGPGPVFSVARVSTAITIDGTLAPGEWAGCDVKKAMPLERGVQHEPLQPRSWAWLAWDDQNLYVGVLNEVSAARPLRKGAKWGQDDAVEVALRNPGSGKTAPIFVLRGYPNGHFESSTESGISADAARKAGEAVKFAAKIVDSGHWAAEYRIPFAALGIDRAKHTKLELNVSVRKSAEPIWIMWQGTSACTWEVGNAGIIALIR